MLESIQASGTSGVYNVSTRARSRDGGVARAARGKSEVHLFNVYLPQEEDDQIAVLKDMLKSEDRGDNLVGGDFNFILRSEDSSTGRLAEEGVADA